MWSSPLPQPLTGYDNHDNFYAKSILVPETTPLTVRKPPPYPTISLISPQPTALLNYFTYIATNGSKTPSWFSELNLLGGPSSKINTPQYPSAYSHRNSLWVLQHYAIVPANATGNTKPTIDFVKGLNEALGMGYKGYLNYVDPELSAKEAHETYYGKEDYERLVRIKKVVDPEAVFWNPQAVGV
ncbi:MAG: hypothetical protein Q9198_006653 [Flavoplaca austrocitrina]